MYGKKPLYRKENTTPVGYRHNIPPGDFCNERHTKVIKDFQGNFLSMHGKKERGYDYTPLFKFLLSKVGEKWDEVYSEAVSRLDKRSPIFWMVRLQPEEDDEPYFCSGPSSYYSKLTVDNEGILVKVDPEFSPDKIKYPRFSDYTYTFNGKLF